MNKHFRRLSIVLAIVMLLTSQFMFAFGADADTTGVKAGDFVVVYTNDVHCGIDGYAALAKHVKELEAITDYVTLVDAGDSVQGEPVGTLSKGEYVIDIMNYMGYDVAIPGNHEFDYGMDQFFKLAGAFEGGYICSNFMDLRTNKPVFDAYRIVEYGDKKVAFVGIDTPEAIVKSTPTYFQDEKGNYIYGFCNDRTGEALYKNVQASIDAAKAEGADIVIAIGHLGIEGDSVPWRSTDLIANVTGLDAFIDGHSHSEVVMDLVKDKSGKEVVLSQTGTKLANIGQLVISGDTITTSLIAVEGHDVDADTQTYIASIKAEYEELTSQVVAKSNVDLTINGPDGQRAIRNAETNLGDLCADAYKTMLGADIAFVNGGGIRVTIPAGDITYGDILAVHPFGNAGCTVEATGQEIVDALEFGARYNPSEVGGFLHVAGLEYTIDNYVESTVVTDELGNFVSIEGERKVSDVKVDGKDIDLNKTYVLASHNYMLKEGGDGFTMFMDNKVLQDEVMLDNQILIAYIQDYLGGVVGSEYEKPQGRINIINLFSDVSATHWAKANIGYVYKNGLFNGTGTNTFSPSAKMTNEMFITVLGRISGQVEAAGEGVYWATPAVDWAFENYIIGEAFDDKANITREDMALYIYHFYLAMGKGPEGEWAVKLDYTDLDSISEECVDAVMFSTIKGFFGGYEDGSFKPANDATRAEVAKVLQLVNEDITK